MTYIHKTFTETRSTLNVDCLLLGVVLVTVHHHQPGAVFETKRAQLPRILPDLARQPFTRLGIQRTVGGLVEFLSTHRTTLHDWPAPPGQRPVVLTAQY